MLTLGELCRAFLDDLERRVRMDRLSLSSSDSMSSTLRCYVLGERRPKGPPLKAPGCPVLASVPLETLTAAHLARFRDDLFRHGADPPFVDSVLYSVRALLNFGVEQGVLDASLWSLPSGWRGALRRYKPRPLIGEPRLADLIAAAGPALSLAIRFAADTGLRTSEQRALRWEDVCLDKRLVRVQARLNRLRQRETWLKTPAGRRMVPMQASTAAALSLLKTERGAAGDALIFLDTRGLALEAQALNKAWGRLQARVAGEWPHHTWHDLRHRAISRWINDGVPLDQVRDWAGHDQIAFTLAVYAHLDERHLPRCAATLEALDPRIAGRQGYAAAAF